MLYEVITPRADGSIHAGFAVAGGDRPGRLRADGASRRWHASGKRMTTTCRATRPTRCEAGHAD